MFKWLGITAQKSSEEGKHAEDLFNWKVMVEGVTSSDKQ